MLYHIAVFTIKVGIENDRQGHRLQFSLSHSLQSHNAFKGLGQISSGPVGRNILTVRQTGT